MTKQEILQFASGEHSEMKGLIYNWQIDDNDQVEILFAAVIGDGTGDNSCIRFNGIKEGERVPTQAEINKALERFIDANGRRNFQIGMCYSPYEFMRINHGISLE